MLVRDIMAKDVRELKPDDTIREGAIKMRDFGIGALPVVDGSEIKGIVTDRDIVIRSIANDIKPERGKIKHIMSDEELHFCKVDDDLQQAVDVMKENKVRRLIVKDNNDKISGILSLGDIATSAKPEVTGKTTEKISQPGD